MRTFGIAAGCWLIFAAVDTLLLAGFTVQQTFYFNIFPGLVIFAIIAACYAGMAVLTALSAAVLKPLAGRLFGEGVQPAGKLPLFLSLYLNCIVNLYIFYRAWGSQISGGLPGRALAAGAGLAGAGFLVWLLVKALKKNLPGAVLAACFSTEVFWCFLRGAFLKGGIFSNITQGLGLPVVFLCALVFGGAVFSIAYFPPWRAFRRAGPGLILLSVCFGAFWAGPRLLLAEATAAQPPGQRPNIILIVLDTLRADHLSAYGYNRKITPNLDAFAAESVLYRRAYSAASWTLPSMAAILTGQYPGRHGAHRVDNGDPINPFNILQDRRLTLAEILKQAGYSTAGFVSCQFVTRKFGMHQGFDTFDDKMPSTLFIKPTFGMLQFLDYFLPLSDFFGSRGLNDNRVAAQINRKAGAWLEHRGNTGAFFLLLHYFDVHHPYYPERLGTSKNDVPAEIRKRYRKKSVNYMEMEQRIIDPVKAGKKPLSDIERQYLVNNYDSEIRRLDIRVGEMKAKLQELGVYDNSLIIITADHGEAFGEHNLMVHGLCLYDDNLHVPLMIKYPKADGRSGEKDSPVSLTGILPTILNYIGIDIPQEVQGASLEEPAPQLIFSQNYRAPNAKIPPYFKTDTAALLLGEHKYIRFAQGEDQLFNLKTDPGETINLIGRQSPFESPLRTAVENNLSRFSAPADSRTKMDSATLENLKALGYLD